MTTTPLENPKWEAFCQYRAHGATATRAYVKAGYTARGGSAHAAASRLAKKAEIQDRIDAIKGAR